MNNPRVTKIIFKGIVQGVGFRPTIYRIATSMHAKGYVLNKGSEVEVVVDVDPDQFIEQVRKHLPSLAVISSVEKEHIEKKLDSFKIIKSKQGTHQSLIPVDTAICEDCLKELFEKHNRRYHYPFINCTVCGARYSLITNVPYDRKYTAMKPFHLCNDCTKEYTDPTDRRFHAQTISCSKCGPTYILYDQEKNKINTDNPVRFFADKIENGSIGVIKSWGGMHLCCTLDQIKRFRKWYHRPQKAFAVMVKSIKDAETYATIKDKERNLLMLSARPIVLVEKRNHELVSPGLESIGLFLPYTAIQYLLFSYLNTNALIMTSANIPGEPMIINNDEAFSLGADYYLLHNRQIPNRIDDTVVKTWENHTFFIRKSRGYVPDPIKIDYTYQIISVGAGQNVYGALSAHQQLFLTQYLGDDTSSETLDFLYRALHHLTDLLIDDKKLHAVIMDSHPGYQTRRVAQMLSEEYETILHDVQHHWAHAASLLVDNKVDEGIVLALDGLGYGDDGTMWGGEILNVDFMDFQRVGHLKPIRLLGGDKATEDPRRLVYAIFSEFEEKPFFSDNQAEIFDRMLPSAPLSSSMGRILDALACYLGICCKRTYDGEPAMKLERYLAKGKSKYPFDVAVSHGEIDTIDLFKQLHERQIFPLNEQEKADIAYSFVESMIKAMCEVAIVAAEKNKVTHIGLTGGVSYNIPITDMVAERVRKAGYQLLVHQNIPNGDGGIAIGQNVIGSRLLK